MSDVPGHTRGIVPLLAEAGIRFLHIGVNSASRAPVVPPLFRWQEPGSGSEVIVMYNAGGYGGAATVGQGGSALYLAHTDDNLGPQTTTQVVATLRDVRARFPEHEVKASTLDAFAAEVEPVREGLPIVREEIGDTWIHGTGSDPWKTAGLRALMRLRGKWAAGKVFSAGDDAFRRFSEGLLMVAEHSWGMDAKTHLGDYESYPRRDFEAARQRDVVTRATPGELAFTDRFRRRAGPQSYGKIQASWNEQRAYLRSAVAALGDTPRGREAARALDEGRPRKVTGGRKVGPSVLGRPMRIGGFAARFDTATGALVSLVDPESGLDWAGSGHALGLFRYQSFSSDDYERFLREYLVNLDDEETRSWALPDYGRLGLTREHSRSGLFQPRAAPARRQDDRISFDLELPLLPRKKYGAPRELQLTYACPRSGSVLDIELAWFGKPANRMPEAAWMSFAPWSTAADRWELHKMGQWLSPLDVVSQGARNLHGIAQGVRLSRAGQRLVIESADAHLVAPGAPRLLQFDDSQPPIERGMHFCLHNNVWGTNFPLWYDDDGRFRFRLRFEADR
jgi:hypothetical protein